MKSRNGSLREPRGKDIELDEPGIIKPWLSSPHGLSSDRDPVQPTVSAAMLALVPLLLLTLLSVSLGLIQLLFQLLDGLQLALAPIVEMLMLGLSLSFGFWCFGDS